MIPHRILVAPDSFGGWKSASEVARQMAAPLRASGFRVDTRPMSDGGEGLLDAMTAGELLSRCEHRDGVGPHGHQRRGHIGWQGATPIIESSTWLRASKPRAPWSASSAGLGAVVSALQATPGVIGLGGSSTVDMGLGFLHRLGATLLDEDGRTVAATARGLHRLHRIIVAPGRMRDWQCWVDVSTPVTHGAAAFGPQKGVLAEDIPWLCDGWRNVVRVWDRWRTSHGLPPTARDIPGGGAAGGLGFTLMQLGARLHPGASVLAAQLLPTLSPSCFVVTGEGCLDATTGEAKVVTTLARVCVEQGASLAVVAGSVGPGAPVLPGRLYRCDGSPDRDIALAEAMASLVDDLVKHRRGQFPRDALEGRHSQ